MDEQQIERYRKRHDKTARRRAKNAKRPRCEAIVWGKKGPHRCVEYGGHTVDGRIVCRNHFGPGRQSLTFTVGDAKAYRMAHPHRPRLEIEQT